MKFGTLFFLNFDFWPSRFESSHFGFMRLTDHLGSKKIKDVKRWVGMQIRQSITFYFPNPLFYKNVCSNPNTQITYEQPRVLKVVVYGIFFFNFLW